jgi:hypothetical protein
MTMTAIAISQARALALSLAFKAIRAYVGSGVFDRVAAQAQSLISADMSGQEKMESLKVFIVAERIAISTAIRDTIVGIVRLRFEQSQSMK